MRDRTAAAVLLLLAVVVLAGGQLLTADLAAEAAPNATFTVDGDADGLVVEHAGGEPLESGTVRVLVYEERRLLPDRTVHGTTWDAGTAVESGDRLVLEDPRFAPGQRLVVRWYGEGGQANLHEARL